MRFWEDAWLGSVPLSVKYPRLFSVSVDQDRKVNEVGVWVEDVWSWRLQWRRARFQWEAKQESDLLSFVDSARLCKVSTDSQLWDGNSSGLFSVKSAYECLYNRTRGSPNRVFKLLWQVKAFPNVLTTAWRALLDRLPTKTCLLRRGVVVTSLLCVMCCSENESAQHLFVECIVAQRIWDRCLRWVGILSAQHRDIQSHFEQFTLCCINYKQNLLWKGVWVAVVSCIWEQRNLIVFQQGVADEEEIFPLAQIKVLLWMKHRMRSFNYSLAEWHLNPIMCLKS